jgi:hypothetical protein
VTAFKNKAAMQKMLSPGKASAEEFCYPAISRILIDERKKAQGSAQRRALV